MDRKPGRLSFVKTPVWFKWIWRSTGLNINPIILHRLTNKSISKLNLKTTNKQTKYKENWKRSNWCHWIWLNRNENIMSDSFWMKTHELILRNALYVIQDPTIQLCWQDNSLSQSLSLSRGTNRFQKLYKWNFTYRKWAMRKHNRMHCSIPSTNHKGQNM